MSFKLGEKSKKELVGVHPDLVAVVEKAIEITPQDFSVHDGMRTLEEQKELVRSGASKTLKSRHLSGYAVDLVPYINGKLRWEWDPIYQIAEAVRTAARELEIPIRWGGVWDEVLTETDEATEDLVSGYIERRRSVGKKAFIDGPHYELPSNLYS